LRRHVLSTYWHTAMSTGGTAETQYKCRKQESESTERD
jgi:hypothetical protein